MPKAGRYEGNDGRVVEEEQKSIALDRILDAWDDALGDGCEPDHIATAAIFASAPAKLSSALGRRRRRERG